MTITVAQGTRSQLLSKTQTAFGTAATGNFTKQKFTTHSLMLQTASVKSATIRSDREIADFRHTTRNAQGDVVVELDYADHDDMIASAMFNIWGSDVISIGTAPQYLTLEDGALDIAKYRLYQDMLVTKWALSAQPGQIVTSTFSFIGTSLTASGSSSGGTAVDAGTNQPFDALTGAIYDDAAESGSALATVTGIQLTVDNGAKAGFTIGSQNAALIEYGEGNVTGQLTLYYDAGVAGSMTSRYLNETEFGLSFSLTDPASQSYEFQLPRIKINDDSVPVQNPQSRIMTVPFQALKPTSGLITSALQLSKV